MAQPYIYVTKNQEIQGPYTASEIRHRIISSHYMGSDLGWHEGRTDWIRLADLLSSLPTAGQVKIPTVRRKSSGFARSSFYIGLAGIVLWLVFFLPIAVSINSEEGDMASALLTLSIFIYGFMGANMLGIVLSFLAFSNRYSSKSLASYGFLFNSIELVLFFFMLK